MLSSGEIISAAINLCVAIYLIYYYPRSVRRQFRAQPMPPLFAVLVKAIGSYSDPSSGRGAGSSSSGGGSSAEL